MATPEERLTLLEQNIRDINHNETMLLGMVIKQGEHIQEIRLNLASLSEHVDTFERNVNSRFESLEQSVNSRFDAVNSRFDAVDSRFDRLEALLTQVVARLPERS